MPFTPFHFGPGAVLHAIAPRHVSFWAFCGANVLIDVEPLYYMLGGNPPLHRFFHTYIGATLVAAVTIALFVAALALARRIALPNIFNWRSLSLRAITLGAFAGVYTHVLLDSIMHHDIAPLAPFAGANHLLGLIPLGPLHWLCVGAGVVAVGIIYLRAPATQEAATADRSDSRSRLLNAAPAGVFAALSDAERLPRWWGPEGFSSTIHAFDFRVGGIWRHTMHGPDGRHYPNESRFTRIEPNRLWEIEHMGHHFILTLWLEAQGADTLVHWRQTFDTVEHYRRIADFIAVANAQNLERLAAEVASGACLKRT